MSGRVSEPEIPDATTAADSAPAEVDYSAIGAVCGNDPRLVRRLRGSLAVIARRTDDPDLRRLCLEVLGGSTSVRRVFEHSSFRQMSQAGAESVERGLDRLGGEQREQLLARIGEHELSEETEFALMEGRRRAE